jgi:hypothetical protein
MKRTIFTLLLLTTGRGLFAQTAISGSKSGGILPDTTKGQIQEVHMLISGSRGGEVQVVSAPFEQPAKNESNPETNSSVKREKEE